MKACRFVARWSPGGRIGSVLDVRKRLHRVRHPFHQSIHIKQGAQQGAELWPKSPMFWIQSPLGSSKRRRMRGRRLPTSTTDQKRPPGDLRATNRQDFTDAPALVASLSRHQEINFLGPQ